MIFVIITGVLIALKIAEVTTISWWTVFAPIYIPIGIYLFLELILKFAEGIDRSLGTPSRHYHDDF